MIPRIIHYCWFGGNPLPELAKKCIESWKKYLPDYEIREWNESNYNVTACDYAKEAYEEKKWAFVSDYARFDILYHHGGIYFDTDVELIAPIDDILQKGAFMGMEDDRCGVNSGLGLAAEPHQQIYREILNRYKGRHFKSQSGVIDQLDVVKFVTPIFQEYGYQLEPKIQTVDGITIYPKEYFCPLDYATGQLHIGKNTRSIHHYTASWKSEKDLKWQKVNKWAHMTFKQYTADKIMCFPAVRLVGSIYRNGIAKTVLAILKK